MKKLYWFKDKIGEEVFEFGIKKPTRTEVEELDIFHSAIFSKYMQMGVQTRAAVDKYYLDNCEGALTKEDSKEMFRLREELSKKSEELYRASGEKEGDKRVALYQEIADISEKIRKYNEYYSHIYDNTAENKARNKTIDFAFLNLSVVGEKLIFEVDEENPQKRMVEQYKKMEESTDGENGSDWRLVYDKLIFLFTLWYMDVAETFEEFDAFFREHYGSEVEKKEEDKVSEQEEEKQKELDLEKENE